MRIIHTNRYKNQKTYYQSPVRIIRLDGDYSSWIKYFKKRSDVKVVIYSRPRHDDSWDDFARRYKLDIGKTKWRNYAEYCRSEQFKKWKQRVLKKYYWLCQICGHTASIAHHLRYPVWGTEKITDGLALCFNCHNNIHKYKNLP